MKKTSLLRQKLSMVAFAGMVTFGTVMASHAAIVAPYGVDTNTLHLYHLDESATPAVDSVAGGNNLLGLLGGATLGNASYSGFGTALSTLDGGQNGTAATAKDAELTVPANGTSATAVKYMNATTAAFTYEALVHIDFDPTKNLGTTANGGNNHAATLSILLAESGTAAARVFQFRIDPIGLSSPINLNAPNLVFVNVGAGVVSQNISVPIPTNGPDAIVSNNWYHVAVTYNGSPATAGNLNFYWTLMDPTRTNASLLSSATMTSNLVSGNIALDIGNTARSDNANFLGLIDEVRISGVARAADQMVFGSPGALITSQPTNLTVGVGQAATFTVAASGAPPIFYQWRFNSNVISGATTTSYTIPSCQLSNAGSYDVIVSNTPTPTVSSEAILTVRTPLNLTWLGLQSGNWDTTNATNWLDTGNSTNAVYSPGDNVTFDVNGSGVPSVSLVGALSPNAITVNANNDYTLAGGSISGIAGLSKSGSGNLILDTDVSITGPVSIQGGTIQLGQNDAHGSLGSGPTVTNNGGILISRTTGISIPGNISGTGGLTNIGNGNITLGGSNTFTGPLIASAGGYVLNGTQTLGNVTNITFNAAPNASGPTTLTLAQSTVINSNVTIQALNTSASPDDRITINASSGTNSINGPLIMTGDGNVQITASGTAELDLNAPIVSPGLTGKFVFRGTSRIVANAPITVGGGLSTTDSGIWTVNATGNTWNLTIIGGSTLRMGAAGVLPAGIPLMVQSGGTLDLAGFNQQAASLADGGTTTGHIGSSSTTSDCVLTLNGTGTSSFGGVIADSLSGGTRRVGVTVTGGGILLLGGTNTYSGPTTITGATLQFNSNGSISNSANINVTAGGAINASTRADGTFTLNAAQTLQGNGPIGIQGNFTTLGTVQLKLNKTGVVLSNDFITNANTINYGGILNLAISGNALTTNDAFGLFSAGSYNGTFSSIVPATPGSGLGWNTNTLATDGTLRIVTLIVPKFSSIQLSGTNLIFNGTNGGAGAQFDILMTTNIATPLSNWVSVFSGNFDGGGAFIATNGIDPTTPKRFFSIRVP